MYFCSGQPMHYCSGVDRALSVARELNQAATLMYALFHTSLPHIWCGNYVTAKANLHELLILAEEKRALHWTAEGTRAQGYISALAGRTTDAVNLITSGIATFRAIGARTFESLYWSKLAGAYAQLGNSDDAWRCIGEAITTIETTRETWFEAEVDRIAGEISLKSPECQRRSNNASAGRSKNTSAILTRRPPNWGPFRQASSLRGIILRGIGAGRP